MAARQGDWLTRAQAAALLGVSVDTIDNLRDSGKLKTYGQRGPGRGSILREDALRAGREYQAWRDDVARRKAEALIDRRPKPPDNEHDWLTTGQTAELLGITSTAVKQRCNKGQAPFEWNDGQRWIRRDLLELRERARAAQKARQP